MQLAKEELGGHKVSSIEFSLVEKDILFGLQQGNRVLGELNKGMSLDMIDKLMSDTAEGVAYQRQVNEMLASTLSADEEDEVMAELERLQAQESEQKLPSVPVHALPEQVAAPERTAAAEQEPEQQRQAIPA